MRKPHWPAGDGCHFVKVVGEQLPQRALDCRLIGAGPSRARTARASLQGRIHGVSRGRSTGSQTLAVTE
jgi:hypothetical protein